MSWVPWLFPRVVLWFPCYQVATTLLVAGSTLTFWIPWQTQCASTSSYSSVVQSATSLGCSYNCKRLTCGSFQLTHMSCDDHAVQLIKFE